MAKKKQPKYPEKALAKIAEKKVRRPQDMTNEESAELGRIMMASWGNIYSHAESRFRVFCVNGGDDEVLFAKVKEHGKVFKCELCGHWKGTAEAIDPTTDVCNQCADG